MARMASGTFDPVGRCIYCGRSDKSVSDEHIVPYGLSGDLVLPKASCNGCAEITSKFEREVLRESLFVPRLALDFPTRHLKNRPTELPLTVKVDDQDMDINVPIDDYPDIMLFLEYKLPAWIDGRACAEGKMVTLGVSAHRIGGFSVEKFASKYGIDKMSTIVAYSAGAFPRLLAKIGYGFAVGTLGLNTIEEVYVLPMILGTKKDYGRWVGCADVKRLGRNGLHLVQLGLVGSEIRAHVRLFARFDAPEYMVVVGRVSERGSEDLQGFALEAE